VQANYAVAAKDLRVCRPLVHVREKTLAQFAKDNRCASQPRSIAKHREASRSIAKLQNSLCFARLPVIADNCPACFAAPKERHRREPRAEELKPFRRHRTALSLSPSTARLRHQVDAVAAGVRAPGSFLVLELLHEAPDVDLADREKHGSSTLQPRSLRVSFETPSGLVWPSGIAVHTSRSEDWWRQVLAADEAGSVEDVGVLVPVGFQKGLCGCLSPG